MLVKEKKRKIQTLNIGKSPPLAGFWFYCLAGLLTGKLAALKSTSDKQGNNEKKETMKNQELTKTKNSFSQIIMGQLYILICPAIKLESNPREAKR